VGNGAERPRPLTTQPSAWRVGNKLRSKIEQEQTLLAYKKDFVFKEKIK
jgi:hypothetical protein